MTVDFLHTISAEKKGLFYLFSVKYKMIDINNLYMGEPPELPDPPSWPRTKVSVEQPVQKKLEAVSDAGVDKSRGDAIDTAEQHGFELVGEGTDRIVVSDGLPVETVAKIAISFAGQSGVQREKKYRGGPYHIIADYMPPVLASDGGNTWVVYEKCEVATGFNDPVIQELQLVLDELIGEKSYTTRELAPTNVGRYNGQPCILDWDKLF